MNTPKFYFEAMSGDAIQDAIINQTIKHDPVASGVFDTIKDCFDAMDDFLARKGFNQEDMNVRTTEEAA